MASIGKGTLAVGGSVERSKGSAAPHPANKVSRHRMVARRYIAWHPDRVAVEAA
jgi:hypothetical protein